MALSKTVTCDRMEVLEMGQIQVRVATVLTEDGVELSRAFHRHVLDPGDSLDGEDPRVVSVAGAVWTDAVIAEWETIRAERQAMMDASLAE